jgi:hypothetical protein
MTLSVCRSDADILGPHSQYLPKIVSIFAEVISDLFPILWCGALFPKENRDIKTDSCVPGLVWFSVIICLGPFVYY